MRYRLIMLSFASAALALGISGQAAAAGIAPSPIDFGDVALNTKATVSMTVTVDSGYSLELASGAGINAPFEFSFGSCSGSTCTDTESLTPTSIGAVGGTLNVFECPIAGGSCIAIPVFVEGTGAYPSLDSPPTLDFGAQTTAEPSAVSWLTVQGSGRPQRRSLAPHRSSVPTPLTSRSQVATMPARAKRSPSVPTVS